MGLTGKEERNVLLRAMGRQLAKALPNHYGKVTFNLRAGQVMNANIEETVKFYNSPAADDAAARRVHT